MKITTINGLKEALAQNIPLNRIYFSEKRKDKRVSDLILHCKNENIAYRIIPEEAIRRKAEGDHQGIYCEAMPKEPLDLNQWAYPAESKLILALDHIWDPGNLGAVFRNAACGAVDGLILNSDRSSPINETVLTRSAGTLLKVNFSLCSNLVNDLIQLKKNGFWVVGASGHSKQTIYDWDFTLPTAVVLGNEQKGISLPVGKQLDASLSIPMANDVDSLNVASASAVIIFEAMRQKKRALK